MHEYGIKSNHVAHFHYKPTNGIENINQVGVVESDLMLMLTFYVNLFRPDDGNLQREKFLHNGCYHGNRFKFGLRRVGLVIRILITKL